MTKEEQSKSVKQESQKLCGALLLLKIICAKHFDLYWNSHSNDNYRKKRKLKLNYCQELCVFLHLTCSPATQSHKEEARNPAACFNQSVFVRLSVVVLCGKWKVSKRFIKTRHWHSLCSCSHCRWKPACKSSFDVRDKCVCVFSNNAPMTQTAEANTLCQTAKTLKGTQKKFMYISEKLNSSKMRKLQLSRQHC